MEEISLLVRAAPACDSGVHSILSAEVLRGHGHFDWDGLSCLKVSLVNNPEIPRKMGDSGNVLY